MMSRVAMTKIPRRRLATFPELSNLSLLWLSSDGRWRYRLHDRVIVVAPARASRILALAANVTGAVVDPADVQALQR